MSRLIHLNGPPGIGKSTLARRYVAAHPGVLNCDVDVLRSLVGGWRDDFEGAGAAIRPAALAMIRSYLAAGRDVVLPQLLLDPAELQRFEGAARAAGADYVERVLMDARDAVVARFHRRGSVDAADRWHEQVRGIVARNGGDQVLLRYHDEFGRHLANRPRAVVITSAEGAEDETYQALVESLAQSTER